MPETYLKTAFKDRAQVKSLGARWDPDAKQWYVPHGRDLSPFEAWLPSASSAIPGPLTTLVDDIPAAPSASTAMALSASRSAPVATTRNGITLSQLMSGVAQAVAQVYKSGVWTQVEVVKADARKGHVYLELAERNAYGDLLAQARAVIWADTANVIVPAFEQATGVVLGAGIKLLVRAKPTVHPMYGMSLAIDAIDPDYTLGDLEARKREIRARLQREGLFDRNRQLASPWDYNAVLVVAPRDAAGLGDFRAEAERLQRLGICTFIYAHSRFQGEGAAKEVRQTLIEALQEWQVSGGAPDAVVVIRGGGAVNDLAWLNDYELARYVCELGIPVLTGIGHERDSTVLDEVANLRYDTPSKVIAGIEQVIVKRAGQARANFEQIAQAATRLGQTHRRGVEQFDATIRSGVLRHLSLARQRTSSHLAGLRIGAMQSLRDGAEQTSARYFDVRQLAEHHLSEARQAVPALMAEVRFQALQAVRDARAGSVSTLGTVLDRAAVDARRAEEQAGRAIEDVAGHARRIVGDASSQAEAMMREIAGQGPAKTLGRGFAIIRAKDGSTLTSAITATAMSSGTGIEIQFHDGTLSAQTTDPDSTST